MPTGGTFAVIDMAILLIAEFLPPEWRTIWSIDTQVLMLSGWSLLGS